MSHNVLVWIILDLQTVTIKGYLQINFVMTRITISRASNWDYGRWGGLWQASNDWLHEEK